MYCNPALLVFKSRSSLGFFTRVKMQDLASLWSPDLKDALTEIAGKETRDLSDTWACGFITSETLMRKKKQSWNRSYINRELKKNKNRKKKNRSLQRRRVPRQYQKTDKETDRPTDRQTKFSTKSYECLYKT